MPTPSTTSLIRNSAARQQYPLQRGSGLNGGHAPKSANSVSVQNPTSRGTQAGSPRIPMKTH